MIKKKVLQMLFLLKWVLGSDGCFFIVVSISVHNEQLKALNYIVQGLTFCDGLMWCLTKNLFTSGPLQVSKKVLQDDSW